MLNNNIYCVDNLHFMSRIPNESIDLIYCDILYNTRKKFKDYNDNLGSPQDAIKWYRPRLMEMKRILKDDGIIALQCDYRLVHYLKVEMDCIFDNNFINEIIWYYKSPSLGSNKMLSNKHDNILVYSRSRNYKINIDDIREEYSETYKKQAEKGHITFGRVAKVNEKGKFPTDVWEIPILNSQSKERVGYSTQKPKRLVEKIVKAFF